MKKIYAATLLLCLLLSFSKPVLGSDFLGAEVTYKCTSTPGIYEVTLVYYRDCSGLAVCSSTCGTACSVIMEVKGVDGIYMNTLFSTFTLTLQNVRDANNNAAFCPNAKSICNNMNCITPGTFTPGIERFEFKGIVDIGTTSTIPSGCCNVRFVYNGMSNRSDNLNSVVAAFYPSYADAIINRCNSISPCNSSPVFNNEPILVTCGGTIVYNNSAYDVDHDSLTYAFAPALQNFGVSLTYNPPFTYNRPMPWTGTATSPFPGGIRCIASTGDVMFTASIAGGSNFYGVIVVEVKQWKTINGVPTVIGITRRESAMILLANCPPNNAPTLLTNPPSTTNINAPRTSWSTCEGQQLCFDVIAKDTDFSPPTINDTTVLSIDSTLQSLGATFTKNYTDSTRATLGPREDSYKFCWTPPAGTNSAIPYYFSIRGSDKRCPLPAKVSQSFSVKVIEIPDININKIASGCGKWKLSYTNNTPSKPVSSVSWVIAHNPNDFNFTSGADSLGNITTTPIKSYTQPGKYLIQLTVNSGTCSSLHYDTLIVDSAVKVITVNDTFICNGDSLVLTATGSFGRSPYSYRWFNSIRDTALTPLNHPNIYSSNFSIKPILSKTYTIQIKDTFGCMAFDSVSINVNKGVKNTVVTDITCNGFSNGTIVMNMLDSTMPYRYQLNNDSFQTSKQFSGLPPGNYTIVSQDTNNCKTTVPNLSITQPTILRDTLTVSTNESCRGFNNGSLSTLALGGTPPYLYSKDSITFSANRTFTNLSPSTYNIHILDAKNCYSSVTRTIVPADTFYYQLTYKDPSCFNLNNGEIRTQGIGGTPPYNYLIGTSGVYNQDSIYESLFAGSYTLNIKDQKGCVVSPNQTLTQPSKLTNTSIISNVSCFGRNDGSISFHTTGGIKPYSYRKTSGSFNSDSAFVDLPAGNHKFYILDSAACIDSMSLVVTEPSLLKDSITIVTNETCKGLNNGQLTTVAIGGTIPYRYSMDSILFNATGSYSNLAPTTYKIHILDNHNCYTSVTRTIIPADSLYHLTSILNPTCFGKNNGEIHTQAIGGKAPYTYRLGTTGSYSNDSIFENLVADTYTLNIKDQNNCTVTFTQTTTQPTQLTSTSQKTDAFCFGVTDGSVTVHTTGGVKPYQYRKGINGALVSDSVFTNLAGGSHTFYTVDNVACLDSVKITINQPLQTIATLSKQNPSCFQKTDGSISVNVTQGKSPFLYALNNGVFGTGNTFTNLAGNNYTVKVKDSIGCLLPISATLTTPQEIVAGSITGTATAIQNITESYSITPQTGLNYTWGVQKGTILSGQNTPSVSVNWDNIGVGNIHAIVYADSTCGDTASLSVNIGVNGLSELAKSFGLEVYPNPSSGIVNITLQKLPAEHSLKLYDIQGKLLIEQELKLSQQLNLESLPQGMYMLKIGEWHGQIIKK